jgi:arylsulfatase A-like enzyme
LAQTVTPLEPRTLTDSVVRLSGLRLLLLIAIWFGIFAGLIEGCGLILFQRLNWQNWGQMLHVSAPIIWISPVVDLALFALVTCLVFVIGKIFLRVRAFPILIFLLSFLTAYDWLTLTGRLYHRSCLLLALGVAAAFTRWVMRNEAACIRFWKRAFLWITAAFLVTFVAIHWGTRWNESREVAELPAATPGSPNVVIIVLDTLRADHVSSYGYARQTSPNIDRLATEGVLFENAVSPTPWSLPSHASLLTGRYQFEHGIQDIPAMSPLGLKRPQLNGFPSLGEVLQKRGYRTGAFSANRVNFTANLGFERGFLHFEDYFHSPADAFLRTLYGREFSRIYLNRTEHSKVKRLLRWFGFNSILDRSDEGSIRVLGALGIEKRATEVNREFVQWIDSGPSGRPFFSFLNYIDVHHPYGGPPSFDKPWKGDSVIDLYDDGIKYVDDCVGELMRELQQRGLAGNTLVVVTSDHGESLGDHRIAFHGEALYREQIHVPLIFWFPGRVPSGFRVPSPVSNASIAATLVSLLNLPAVPEFKRPAIDGLWKAPQPDSSSNVLSEVSQLYPASDEDIISEKEVPVSMNGAMKSLSTSQWELIAHEKLGNQLYNYARDPGEKVDRFGSAQFQQVAGELLMQMQAAVSDENSLRSAAPLAIGTTKSVAAANGLYRMTGGPGETLDIELRMAHPRAAFKPVLSVFGSDGSLFQTCENPGDDDIEAPGVPDPTPGEFDDLCMNNISRKGSSEIEILVPAASRTPVELYVRVSDWDGRTLPAEYQIVVNSAAASH